MTALRSISYISSTEGTLSAEALERLLVSAREFNEGVGVTGVLLYNGSAFFQYFEGEVLSCDAVLARINSSSSHHSIHVLVDQLTRTRHFSNWMMGFSAARNSEILSLSQAQWKALPESGAAPLQEEPSGVAMLKGFWQAATGVAVKEGPLICKQQRQVVDAADAGFTQN